MGRFPGRPLPLAIAWRTAVAAAAVVAATLVTSLEGASADVTFNQRMLELVNGYRSANGLRPVIVDATLGGIAEDTPYGGCGFTVHGRAKDMGQRNYFSHTIPDCGSQSVFNMTASTGVAYSGVAENIALLSGTTDPLVAAENLHNQLIASPGHRANILNAQFTKVGVGSWRTSPGQTWSRGGVALTNVWLGVQIFAGGPVGPAPTVRGAGYHALTPSRILDTRTGIGSPVSALGAGATMNVQVTGRGGVPSTGVSAVVVNVTVTQPTAPSYLTVFPTGEALPLAANLNYVPGQTVPNLVTAKLGGNGQISVYNAAGNTHIVADVAGWYDDGTVSSGARFHPLTPNRILDTRTGNGAPAALVGPGTTLDLQVTGRGGVPLTGVSAVMVNITVTGPTAPTSYLTAFPTGESLPLAANLNYVAGQTVANLVTAKLGVNGRLSLYNATGSTHIVADVAGWFDAGGMSKGARFHPLAPSRILDTRTGNGSAGPVGPGGTINLQVTGRGGVPVTGVSAVILNVTVTGPTAGGYLTAFPTGEARPLAANLNYVSGQTVPNLVSAKLGTNGQLSLFNASGSTHIVADVAGWYDAG